MTRRAHERGCPPGSHPHADQPNWRPAESLDDDLQNCREGLEVYSDRRAARLLGISRVELWRWKLIAEIPGPLFERLLNGKHRPTTKALAEAALALRNDGSALACDVEHCPNCGHVLRVRRRLASGMAEVVRDWAAP
jgi:hypothetical protein